MVETIRSVRKQADEAYATAMESRLTATQARADYYRLRTENRDRFAAQGKTSIAADMAFGRYDVAKDCIEAERMHGRWAEEGMVIANANYAQAVRLMDDLARFMREHRSQPVPRQRSGS